MDRTVARKIGEYRRVEEDRKTDEAELGPLINGLDGPFKKEVLVTVTTPSPALDAVIAPVPSSSVVILHE